MNFVRIGAVLFSTLAISTVTFADTISHGGTTVDIDFVAMGHTGNSADASSYGSVSYNYRLAKYEVTADQWASVIANDARVGNAGAQSGLRPTGGANWYESAKFCNWLTSGDAYSGAYQFNSSGVLIGLDRNAAVVNYGTAYVLPTEDEWYKAAYFKSDGTGYTLYPTGDSTPVAGTDAKYGASTLSTPWNIGSGSMENNGTYDMGGNHWEWIESAADGVLDNLAENRVLRGGAYSSSVVGLASSLRISRAPTNNDAGYYRYGIRVAAIPEPSSVALLGVAGITGFFFRKRLRR